MADYLTNDTELTSIANAIRSKSGSSGTMEFPDGFVSAIGNIPTGGGSSGDKTVVFFDDLANNGEGGVVTSYTPEEFAALSAMPANPDHSTYSTHGISIPMTSQGWNWSLADAKSYVAKYGALNIGQMYVPTDGKSHYICYVPEGTSPERRNTYARFKKLGDLNNYINWQIDDGEINTDGAGAIYVVLCPDFSSDGWHDLKIFTENETSYAPYGSSNSPSYEDKGKISKIKEVYLGENVYGIDRNAFVCCSSLKLITAPISVTMIETYAFQYCESLKSFTIPLEVTTLGTYSFAYAKAIRLINSCSNLSTIAAFSFYYCYSLTSFNLPDELSVINESLFRSCSSLKSIVIPNNVTSIGTSAFYYCYSLKSIKIPNGVTIINNSAFRTCYCLESIELPDTINTIGGYAFAGCYALTSINIPEGVTRINFYTFQNCSALANISLPSTITYVGEYAFSGCCSVSSINISKSTNIGERAFNSCHALYSFQLSDELTAIGDNAFYECFAVSVLNIPASVTSIGASAFSCCTSIKNIIMEGSTPPTLSNVNAFSNLMSDYSIIVPQGSLSAYTSATNWADLASHIVEAT